MINSTSQIHNDDIITKEKNEENAQTLHNITRIEEIIQSEELDTAQYGCVYSLIEIPNNRIITGGWDGNISISSYNIPDKTWKREVYKEKAHNSGILSLCTLNNNRFVSGSNDKLIKVWTISELDITLLKEIKEHIGVIHKLIPLSNKRFASCSSDKTVRIWKDDDNTYECISTLKHDAWVRSILQLRGKEVLVTSNGYFPSSYILFYNIDNYTQEHTVKGYCAGWSSHMVELSDGNVALSSVKKPHPIVIIDTSSYQIITMIQLKDIIPHHSTLYAFNEHSFIYIYEGTFLQISSENYSIVFKSNGERFNGFYGGIIPLEGGKYFAIENCKRIFIVKPY
jgi:WD40 repeat protein